MARYDELTPAQKADHDAAQAAIQAEEAARKVAADADKAARDAALADTPASVNSVPLIREELDKVKAVLRELFP